MNTARNEGRQKRSGRPVSLGDGDQNLAAQAPSASAIITGQEIRLAAGRAIVELQLEHPDEMEAVLLKVYESQSWPRIRQEMQLTSEKRARTLFARGIDLLRPQVECRLGEAAFADFLEL